jgi:proteic killer suppression protein
MLNNNERAVILIIVKGFSMVYKVQFSTTAEKQLAKLPKPIIRRLFSWVASVEEIGLPATQQIRGYHDEPLLGVLKGKRSVRLNIQWRLIYEL